MIDQIILPAGFSLRAVKESDEKFLVALFSATRQDLQMLLPPAQYELLMAQQYAMQTASYAVQYPDAYRAIIQLNNEPIGKIILHVNEANLRIVDFGVAEPYRNKGYGSLVLTALQEHARTRGLVVELAVDRQNNLAQKLYLKCGFMFHSSSDTHLGMRWSH